MRIGYVETYLTVSETESDVLLEVQLLEGTIAPELGNIVVTVSTSDQTASGAWDFENTFTLCMHRALQAHSNIVPTFVATCILKNM